MQQTTRARAKINWALLITGTRQDGYHDLDMLMQSIGLCDELQFAPSHVVSLQVDGRRMHCGERNLVVRAANALLQYTGLRAGAKISLNKKIPIRAGLGGGSADCASTLLALNKLWKLNLSTDVLAQIGLSIGADVPFCLYGGFARVGGIGERLVVADEMPGAQLVIVKVGGGLSTADVFRAWDEKPEHENGLDLGAIQKTLIAGDFASLRGTRLNDLEAPAIRLLPEIAEAKEALYREGALFAQMTGSGSAVYGVFASRDAAARAQAAIGQDAILTET